MNLLVNPPVYPPWHPFRCAAAALMAVMPPGKFCREDVTTHKLRAAGIADPLSLIEYAVERNILAAREPERVVFDRPVEVSRFPDLLATAEEDAERRRRLAENAPEVTDCEGMRQLKLRRGLSDGTPFILFEDAPPPAPSQPPAPQPVPTGESPVTAKKRARSGRKPAPLCPALVEALDRFPVSLCRGGTPDPATDGPRTLAHVFEEIRNPTPERAELTRRMLAATTEEERFALAQQFDFLDLGPASLLLYTLRGVKNPSAVRKALLKDDGLEHRLIMGCRGLAEGTLQILLLRNDWDASDIDSCLFGIISRKYKRQQWKLASNYMGTRFAACADFAAWVNPRFTGRTELGG